LAAKACCADQIRVILFMFQILTRVFHLSGGT
jgi:hypothetical protein